MDNRNKNWETKTRPFTDRANFFFYGSLGPFVVPSREPICLNIGMQFQFENNKISLFDAAKAV